jgi:hypothetical protein
MGKEKERWRDKERERGRERSTHRTEMATDGKRRRQTGWTMMKSEKGQRTDEEMKMDEKGCNRQNEAKV